MTDDVSALRPAERLIDAAQEMRRMVGADRGEIERAAERERQARANAKTFPTSENLCASAPF